ncbi:MAG TPA: zinc metalloprotease HtpX [Solirubrobacteraceae bacterium]|jgi:heat shock protein HtpX|nr:zinc metalloprotease HtpX [Solirubrobacteraceae bacterium]
MAQPREFGKDTGLQFRIVLVLFLLGAVYAVLVAALIAAGVNAALVGVIAVVLLLVQLFASDKIGLAAMGAHEVTPDQAPELHAMIERLCVQANLPKPKVAIVETQAPNAFAMGRSPKNATVCVTTGILQLLSPAELEGVLAHELTHVQNRDVVVMTLASFFATIAAYIVQFGFFFGGDDDSEEGGIGVLGLILVSLVVYAVSFVLLQALSRYREYAADRGSAIITGRPSALASALLKISGASERIPAQDLRATQKLKAFYIYWPSARELIASHPSTEQRIAALQRLEAQLQGVPAAA